MEDKYYILERTQGTWSRVMFRQWQSKAFLKRLSSEIEKAGYFRENLALVSNKSDKPGTYLFIKDAIREPFAFLFGTLYEKFHLEQSADKSSLEKKMDPFLTANGFIFTGDGSLIIGNRSPDFLHLTEKKLIEIFGEAWHKPAEERERLMHYRQYGFECCVIWGSEIDRGLAEQKILNFLGGKAGD